MNRRFWRVGSVRWPAFSHNGTVAERFSSFLATAVRFFPTGVVGMGSLEAPTTSPTLLAALADWQNAEAWEAFTRGYVPYIDACVQIAGLQDADVTEVRGRVLASLVTALRTLPYDPARRFRGYVRVCVSNAIRSYFRESNRRPGSVGVGGDPTQAALESEPLSPEFEELAEGLDSRTRDDLELLWRIFAAAKSRLAATTWLSFELTRLKAVSPQEAAEQLNISVANLYVYRGRVLETLRTIAREFGLVDE